MKKWIAILLSMMVLLSGLTVLAEDVPAVEKDDLTIGSVTALTGNFFTDLWGNNTADADVRSLLHGYNLMQWEPENATYGFNDSVVSGVMVTRDVVSGNHTYTIALYNDLYYSDGTQITAWDYAFSWLLCAAPQMKEIGGKAANNNVIRGMENYRNGKTDHIKGVRVINDFQMEITLLGEYLPFFYEVALLDCVPYPIHVIAPDCTVADDDDGVSITGPFTADVLRTTVLDAANGYLSHPSVVSGPYCLLSYDAASSGAEFAVNPFYKGDAKGVKPQIAKLHLVKVDRDTAMNQLVDGKIDLLSKVVREDTITAGIEQASQGLVSSSNYPRNGFSFISFSCERPATGSNAVRQAIALCFDKETFVADYVNNYGVVVDGFYGVGQMMYRLATGAMQPPLEEPAEGASKAELDAYAAQQAGWEALNLNGLNAYALDTAAAAQLLADDGWTLNQQGGTYDASSDTVRCKMIDDQLVSLELSMIYPQENDLAGIFQTTLVDHLAQAGIVLHVEAKPFAELLQQYYRTEERTVDMIYMASNFQYVYNPAGMVDPADALLGGTNRTGIADDELYRFAVEMNATEPGDVLGYCQKWVAFQERFSEVLPMLPIYSNVYFDFYTTQLQAYAIVTAPNWAEAVAAAYLGEAQENLDLFGDDFIIE